MRTTTEPEIVNEIERRLHDLEVQYIRGSQALRERNRLVLEMVQSGYSQADIYRRLNKARREVGGAQLTRDAIFMLVRRAKGLIK